MELCLEDAFSSTSQPCVGFDSVPGAIANVIALIALVASLTLVVRVVHAVRRESAFSDADVKRIVLRGVNPWLFVSGCALALGAYVLTRLAA